MRALFNFKNLIAVHYAVILFAAYLLPLPFLIFLVKREIFGKLKVRFRQSHDNLIGKHVGKAGRI